MRVIPGWRSSILKSLPLFTTTGDFSCSADTPWLFFFLSQALLLPLRVQRLPVVINFNCVAKAVAQTHSQRVHNDPFSHSTFGHCCRADTRAHAHKHPHTGERGESKGVFVTATFISFSLMALHTETHLQKCTVRTEQQARLLFLCDSTLL